MPKLTDIEKTKLEVIADSNEPLVAKRAMIILMNDADVQPDNIAKEVEFTPGTVKRWLREFEKKGFAIFPDQPNGGGTHLPLEATFPASTELEVAEQTPVEEARIIPKKTKQAEPKDGEQASPAGRKSDLEPTDSFAEAGRKVLAFHFSRMVKHETDVRKEDEPEKVHEMRVAIRRMRAAFIIFGPAYRKKATKPLRAGLKETGQVMGPVRDLDVFREHLQRYQQTLPEAEQKSLQVALDIWAKQHRHARKEMLAYLRSKKYTRFKGELQEFVKTERAGVKTMETDSPMFYQLRHVAASLIYEAYQQVRVYETILENAPPETLHQLRIAFKRLRYLLEFLQEVLGEEIKLVIKEIKVMQDYLGSLQDAEVANKIIKGFMTDWESSQAEVPAAEQLGPEPLINYREARLEERRQLLASFLEAWANFNRPEVRRSLAKAVSVL